jgi:flagellar L-ring protein precursor FlgH
MLQGEKKAAKKEPSPLDRYISEAEGRSALTHTADSPGSLYSQTGIFSDLARDPRARQLDDIVTVVVLDRASAIAKGVTNTSRKSSTDQNVGSFLGKTNPLGKWANLASTSGQTQIQGQGQTSRETTLTTTVSARVTHVLPNGNLVLEGQKTVSVSSEQQTVTVRGVIRPSDIGPGNTVRSDQLAQLEVRVNGKGVVGDAIRRPFILYRILLGLLPF